jgi:hypothetical protein
MEISSPEVDQDESVESDNEKSRSVHRYLGVSASFLLLILIIGILFASRYQPIVVAGGLGIDHPIAAHQVEATQEFLLRNTGPIGVTIVALKSGERSGSFPESRIAPAMICPFSALRGYECRQAKKTGLLQGVAFHPFSLTTDNSRPVLWYFKYRCVASTAKGAPPDTLTLPVTYRFLSFTHTIELSEPADQSLACSPT